MTDDLVYTFMLAYQSRYGIPPKLREIVTAAPKTHHRSSVYYALHRLQALGMVAEIKPLGYSRRYEAIPQNG